MSPRKPGLLAPLFALLLAAGAGALVYAQEARSEAERLALLQAAEGPQRLITPIKQGGWSFPRRFEAKGGAILSPQDTHVAALIFSTEATPPRLFDLDGDGAPDQALAARPAEGGGFLVGAAPLTPPPSLPWGLLCVALLFSLGMWAWLAFAYPGRWAGPLGAGFGALNLGLIFSFAASRALDVLPGARLSGALPLAAALIPLVLYGALGAYTRSLRSPHRAAFAYIAPAMIGMSVLILVPFAFGFGLAFFRFNGQTSEFVGLSHFAHILASSGYAITHPLSFYYTLFVTVMWTALNVALHVSIGLGIALILREPTLRFKGVYRVLLIVPWAVPNYITALIWRGMFNAEYGLINHGLSALGLEKIQWFSAPLTAFAANLITNTWLGFPFMMVVALGALQSIPRDLYEAADVDGADGWQKFKLITLPLLRPALLPAIILGSVWTFNMFNIIYLVSQGRPNNSTDILIVEAYRVAFEQERYGYAAAYSVLIFLLLLLYSRITERVSKAAEEAYG
ncbi:sugar ABC transporter permease [Myxococcota bacterium]|nr:sugar ABC transporter permease [Myxococcota bacterium]MBU1433085.1 sugar ABC transporter permease [Myxococcota bacterium]MBU1897931.1 sugar ABC transporter permease [Myxococcota bacterium]